MRSTGFGRGDQESLKADEQARDDHGRFAAGSAGGAATPKLAHLDEVSSMELYDVTKGIADLDSTGKIDEARDNLLDAHNASVEHANTEEDVTDGIPEDHPGGYMEHPDYKAFEDTHLENLKKTAAAANDLHDTITEFHNKVAANHRALTGKMAEFHKSHEY